MEGRGSGSQGDAEGEELHTVVREGVKARVEELLKEGRGESIVDYKQDGETPLHVAARMGRADIVDVLIKVGHADIHARSREGNTPLHVAAQYGHEGVVEKLLQQGAASDLTVEDRDGNTPLHWVAQSGTQKIVKRMLSLAPSREACIYARNAKLRTPLHHAAGSGNPKVVALLKDDVTIRACDEFGAIPFHFAARSGDVKTLEMLLPSDINVENTVNGLTALHYAACNARNDAVKWLMERGALVKPSQLAKGVTPLHLAAISKEQGSDKVVETILTKASDSWKMQNHGGELAVGLADKHKNGHVIRAILQSLRRLKPSLVGYDIFTPKHEPIGATLLHYAAGYGTKEDMEWLLTALGKGRKVDEIVDKSRRNPLHWAAMKGNTNTLKALAYAGADLRKVGNEGAGETPLFLALGEAHLDFAEELLKCDKELSKKDGERKCLTTDEWMEGVERWMMTYYNDKVEKHVKDELLEGFKRHTRDQTSTWLPVVGNGGAMREFYEIPPLYLALHAGRVDIAIFFQRLSSDEDAVNKTGTYTGRTALHWAVLFRKRLIVEQLCFKVPELSERIRVCEEDAYGIAPVQYATEMNMQDIEAELFKRDTVSKYIDGLYRDREIYVDSTNAILVCAALIASVTFAGWLQPPLGYVSYPQYGGTIYAAIQHKGMRVFWVLNSLSFFTAIGTVQAGACGVLPLRHVHIGRAVIYIRRALMVASLLMALSVACVLGAFGAAGIVVLPPYFKFEVYMMSTIAFGGLINAGLILWFVQRVILVPQLLQIWIRRRLRRTLGPQGPSSPPPDLTTLTDKATPSPPPTPQTSISQEKPMFSWDDKIEELYTRLSHK